MEQSLKNCLSAGQKITSLLWNLKAHHRVQNSPPLDPILRQLNPVHAITPYFFKIPSGLFHFSFSVGNSSRISLPC
jgi:hypothetical protein